MLFKNNSLSSICELSQERITIYDYCCDGSDSLLKTYSDVLIDKTSGRHLADFFSFENGKVSRHIK